MLGTKLRSVLVTFSAIRHIKRALSVDVAVKHAASSIGQGPHWDDATQTLLHVDVLTGEVHRWDYGTGDDERINLGSTVGLVVPRKNGGYIVGLGQSLSHFDWDTKVVTKLKEVEESENTRFSDGKCDAAGRLWAGTVGTPDNETAPWQSDLNIGNLYSLGIDGTNHVHRKGISVSNGPAWTSDNRTMFHIDSAARTVFAYDFDLESGRLANKRECINFGGKNTLESLGYPDGVTIDTEDKLWIACNGIGKVVRFDPNTGQQLQSISIPTTRTTSCCFGGKNLDELFVTSSRFGLTEEEKKDNPLAGSVFRVTGLGFKGFPANCYHG